MSWGGDLISAIRFWGFALGLHDFLQGASSAAPGKAKLKQVLFVFALGLH